ncbi:hypothetical protein FAZ19_10080 [Sphingobacterium alkalisoli]|uniref:chitinase n=1 Tax=Sphingobacterium alkalisoli TaxID=1874115 RepID=A0A4U0H1P4_9SPHI|nr:glycosyl hydrolase family 18 protein [Sphingobacterium alkalisoli]TJY65480.1 hypothetical protein FAZ19_10080 [Sphingobacterium alkalisoli]GGH20203.1 chitinase [Sphingobacterium alkalisoli]
MIKNQKITTAKWIAYFSFIFLFLMNINCSHSEIQPHDEVPVRATAFRVVGYFRGDLTKDLQRVDFSALTHINIAFANPDSTGKFPPMAGLKQFVNTAHQHGVKILISIAGGRAPKYYKELISPANRTVFIAAINEFLDEYDLDGIDVDLEGDLITEHYEGFITALGISLDSLRLMTAAVATEYGWQVPVDALEKLDFVNIMSYDKTGPWNPSRPGPHAPYEMAVEDIQYWHEIKGVPKDKLNLGLPFYGHSFNGPNSTSYTYNRIVSDYPGAEYKDELTMKDGSVVYYNGVPTIRRKTALALHEIGGVMIWQLVQDAAGEKSLLKLIKDVVDTAAKNRDK